MICARFSGGRTLEARRVAHRLKQRDERQQDERQRDERFERLHARQRRAGGLCDRSLPCHKFEQVDCAGGQIARSPRGRAPHLLA